MYAGRGLVFAVLGEENACPGAYADLYDDGLEQPANVVFGAVIDGAGVEAAGGAAVLATVDAAECSVVAGAGLATATGGGLNFSYAECYK